MKALSIRQPWCQRILFEGKDVENRSWPTAYRGPVLIHASKSVAELDRDEWDDYPRGGIVGHAEIVDCVTSVESDWFFGPYGFVLANVRPLPLIPCRGALGFFTPDIMSTVARMAVTGDLTEGQGAKVLSMDRVAFRTLCDEAAARLGAFVAVCEAGGE